MSETKCSVKDCDRKVRSAGFCGSHYNRFWRGRDVNVPLVATPKNTAINFWQGAALTANPDICWLWQRSADGQGYGFFRYEGKQWRTHRLAYYLAMGKEPVLDVLHFCDTPACVNPNHLREGTDQDNTNDKVSRRRHRFGETQRSAKLTNAEVRNIKIALREKTATQKELAERYNVSDSTLSLINQGKIWKLIEI